jgi:hypothetical protein
MSVLCAEL